ncbi:hypothetical protein [Mycobacterium nebraskense]|uniref:Uncharacterized protein n=1 Tax=Mycobacterium nebraskense TaxID=244292 RepID=A0A1X1ZC31_9MYCO|nr:hypothetical protein [Mycobacterium nebraskense]KKC03402.1 hypothetical protein WU83_19140 [Mycobacterium nebraskense]ORW20800.1 hypothetical protein AWC17_07330 [Mycobacterium nebraskense]
MFSSKPEPIRLRWVAVVAVAVASVVAAAVVLIGTAHAPSPVRLASAEPIEIAQGVSIVPAPGWTLGHRGPNWVALSNADLSAQLRVTVKPAGGTDAVAVLQADKNQLVGNASAILGNVRDLSEPHIRTLPGPKFQQEASIDYTADVLAPEGAIPVIGTFTELLNTSSLQSAFIDYRQDNNATPQAASDGGMMIESMF